MIKKRSKFWTVAFAFLPGAGHMFNGFMKMGLSLMTTFFVLFFMAIVMNLGALAVLTPVVWFYAFFDCINKRFQDDEEFYAQEDEYLFSLETIMNFDFGTQGRKRQIWGAVLLTVGIYILWNNVIWGVLRRSGILPTALWNLINSFNYMLPQLIVCLLIIYFGLVLIRGKKEELEEYDDDEGPKEQGPGYYDPYEGGFRREAPYGDRDEEAAYDRNEAQAYDSVDRIIYVNSAADTEKKEIAQKGFVQSETSIEQDAVRPEVNSAARLDKNSKEAE